MIFYNTKRVQLINLLLLFVANTFLLIIRRFLVKRFFNNNLLNQ